VSGPDDGGTHPPNAASEERGSHTEGAPGGAGAGGGGGEALSRVSVTVDDAHLSSLDDVVGALRERGMHVETVLEGLGMVTGSAPDAAALRQVEGVSGVDVELEHRIAPPEDEIQ
jgi:hypothetical protein